MCNKKHSKELTLYKLFDIVDSRGSLKYLKHITEKGKIQKEIKWLF